MLINENTVVHSFWKLLRNYINHLTKGIISCLSISQSRLVSWQTQRSHSCFKHLSVSSSSCHRTI